MSHKKGFKPTYGVFSYTCSDFSSARSLLEFKPQVITIFGNEKRTPNRLDLVFTKPNTD